MYKSHALLGLVVALCAGCTRSSACERAACWTRRSSSACGDCLSSAQGSSGTCQSAQDALNRSASTSALNALSSCLRGCEGLGSGATCANDNGFCTCISRCQQEAPSGLGSAHEDYLTCVTDRCDEACR